MNDFKRTHHSFSGLVFPAYTECPECDCSRCTITYFFYEDYTKSIDPITDSRAYISNHADCEIFTCPSCRKRRKC